MLGNKAVELLKDFSRSTDAFPPFQDDTVRQIIEEIKVVFEENCQQAAEFATLRDRSLWPLLNLRHAALQRNKRCLLTYLHERLNSIKALRWEFGPVVPADIKSSFCEAEVQFFNSYSTSLTSYMRSIGDGHGIDLTGDLKPPKSLFLEVRCMENYGKFELEDGEVIYLKKNSQHYLPRTQIEPLIRQGILQHIS